MGDAPHRAMPSLMSMNSRVQNTTTPVSCLQIDSDSGAGRRVTGAPSDGGVTGAPSGGGMVWLVYRCWYW